MSIRQIRGLVLSYKRTKLYAFLHWQKTVECNVYNFQPVKTRCANEKHMGTVEVKERQGDLFGSHLNAKSLDFVLVN